MPHEFHLRVYYEDTDAAGIVYYANYLRFIERARSEALLSFGISQTELRNQYGIVFAVSDVTARYRAPAHLEDQLVVKTTVCELRGARVVMEQNVVRDSTLLVECQVAIASLNESGRPVRLPRDVVRGFSGLWEVPHSSLDT